MAVPIEETKYKFGDKAKCGCGREATIVICEECHKAMWEAVEAKNELLRMIYGGKINIENLTSD